VLDKLIQLIVNGVMAGAVLALPAIGLTTIFAVLRFVDFAVAAHMAVGAYAGYLLNSALGLPPWAAILGAFLTAGAVGIATDHVALKPLRRSTALTLAIASIALNIMVESALRVAFGSRSRMPRSPSSSWRCCSCS
jgi:branched-chain amino acid transport system permease protein